MEEQTAVQENTGSRQAETALEPPKKRRINRSVLAENLWGWFFVCFLVIGTTAFIYFALVLSVWMSFTNYSNSSGTTLWEALKHINPNGWDYWYKFMFSPEYTADGTALSGTGINERFWTTLLNAVIYMIGIPIGMALSLFLAVLLSRDIKGAGAFRVIYYIPTVASVVSIAVLWNNLFGNEGVIVELFGTRFLGGSAFMQKVTVVIMTTWKGLGGSVLLLCAGLNGVNASYHEAAQIDGANAWRIFWRITMPQLWPTIFYCIVTSVIGGMQIFSEPQLLYGSYLVGDASVDVTPFVGMIYGYYGQGNYALSSALGVVLAVIIFLLTLVQFALDKRRDA